jgi:hypothetical protein
MHPFLAKRIELPWFEKIHSVLTASLSVWPLAAITIASSLLCGAANLFKDRVGIELGVWCGFWAMLGPICCLFLVGLLLVAFIRTVRRHGLVFGLGMAFGLAAFAAWFCACIQD